MDKAKDNFNDINLICKNCGDSFVFSAADQLFYTNQGFKNVPARCKKCREEFQKKQNKGNELYNVHCVKCNLVGKIAVKPLYPKQVYCETCFIEELAHEKQIKGHLPQTIFEAKENLA